MINMAKNGGIQFEKDFVNALHEHSYGELNQNLKFLIKTLYKQIDLEEKIHAELVMGYVKPDVRIFYMGQEKYISLKSGASDVIHQEKVEQMVEFFRSNGISEKTIETILLFQFGDNTTDGSGEIRLDYTAISFQLHDRIIEANIELNKSKQFINACLKRFLFQGTREEYPLADIIYHGNLEYGVFMNYQQTINHMKYRTYDFIKNIHIGPMHIKAHARYHHGVVLDEESRHKTDIRWVNLNTDIDYISRKFSFDIGNTNLLSKK